MGYSYVAILLVMFMVAAVGAVFAIFLLDRRVVRRLQNEDSYDGVSRGPRLAVTIAGVIVVSSIVVAALSMLINALSNQ